MPACADVHLQRGDERLLRNVHLPKAFAERLRPALTELEGLSANAAAKELDRRAIVIARGGKWSSRSIIKPLLLQAGARRADTGVCWGGLG